jgi:uncharacterized protein YerC
MPRVSKIRLEHKQLEEMNTHLSYLISSLNNSREIENFLEGFLTKEEKTMLTKRLVLFMLVRKGYSPSAIQAALHVSYETVRTYNNQLALKNKSFNEMVDKLIKREQTRELFTKIDNILKPLSLALDAKRNMKSRAKLLSGDY